jgi:hypothetical protein
MKTKLFTVFATLLFLSFFSGTARASKDPAGFITLTPIVTIAPTASSTPAIIPDTATSTTTPYSTPTPNASATTYEQLIDVQKSVLETTRWAVTGVLAVITTLSCVGGIIASTVTILGGLSGLALYTRISDAAKRADETKITVDRLKIQADETKTILDQATITFSQLQVDLTADIEKTKHNLNLQVENTLKQANEAKNIADQTVTASTQVQQELKETQADLKGFKAGVKGDIKEMRNTLLLVQLEERSIELYSDDPEEHSRAKKALKALSALDASQHPAFARRHATVLLGSYAVEFQDQEIIVWLEKIAEEDLTASVRRTAEHYLKKFKDASNASS